ncbi:trypsin [Entelurus aequoreus]|uniref:trypsin n=1 Tax=Entelurus aequoreus TaxID=161455 RepID=UPI002B1E8232|nr:trypsin [Entelurus aequoreus]
MRCFSGVAGSRIIGGVEAPPYSIKYQASLKYFNSHFCGGTLVHPQWVVSAAHCWRPSHMIKVVLSELHLTGKEGVEQRFNVSVIVTHPDFLHWTFDNDIMMLKLDRPATLNARVDVATLPAPDSQPPGGRSRCTVSGWGVTWVGSSSLSPVLRSVDVDIFPDCWHYYIFALTHNMMCAGSAGGRKDACLGDSGGPLVCDGRFEGIVSWGIGCGHASFPGVYTKVRNYLGWISRVMEKH